MSCVPCCWPALPAPWECAAGHPPPPGQRPRRGGVPGTATGSLSGHQKGRAGRPSCFSARPVQDAAAQESGCGPPAPGPGDTWCSPHSRPRAPHCGQPGVCPGAGPWVFLWVLQAHPECSFGSSAHLWCTCRGSDVTPEVPIPGGGRAPGMGVGVRPLCVAVHYPPSAEVSEGGASLRWLFLRPSVHLPGSLLRWQHQPLTVASLSELLR